MGVRLKLGTDSSRATEQVGQLLGRLATPDLVIALEGDLGAGKTTLVRGLGTGLGVTERISSPTYTLMHSYPGRLELFHFDAWMEGREAAFLDGGGAEWFTSGGVSVVEWASRVRKYLPGDLLDVEMIHTAAPVFDEDGMLDPDQDRGLVMRPQGPRSEALVRKLVTELENEPLAGVQILVGIS